uniref:MobA/VirD2-like nuclease domain-containing protein n=1 Tax=Vibrio sp. FF_291 TaxID=1652832 RepID=A0A0H3ZT08_9VIBR|nr:hypothetical protein [Vibrio sp. FF_291]
MELEDLLTRKGKKGRFSVKSYHRDVTNNKAKEVIFKVASNITNSNPKSVGQAMDYITRNGERYEEEFISPENELGNKLSQEEMKVLQEQWEKEFAEDKRENSRLMTHFILSIDEKPTDKNIQKFETATRDFLQERLGNDGYRYMFVIHKHNDKAHAHILVNNYNELTKKKLRTNKQWFLESRILAKEKLIEQGFNYKATLRQDRKRQKKLDKEISKEQDKKTEEAKGHILMEHDAAPYQFDGDNKMNYFVKLSNDSYIWGINLERAIKESDAKVGDRIDITSPGTETVEDKDGNIIKTERVNWVIKVTETKEQIEEKQEREENRTTEKSQPRDWFDAMLRKIARNDEHYQTLLEWKNILVEAQKKQIEKSEANQARNQIIALERYSRNAGSQEAFHKVIRKAGLTHEDILRAREKVKKRRVHQDRKLELQIRSTARDLVKAEIGIELSPDMTPQEKAEMLEVIENTKRQIDPKNIINFYGIKQQLIKEANYSQQFDRYLKELRKVNRSEAPTEKSIYRLFRQTPEERLNQAEKVMFQRERDKTFDVLESKGFPVRSMFRKWQEMEKITNRAKELSTEGKESGLSPYEEQKLINAMRERLEKVAQTMRDKIRVGKSLDAAQRQLDARNPTERKPIEVEIFKQLASLRAVDNKKSEGKEQLANRQLFAMSKTYLTLVNKVKELEHPEQQSVKENLARLEHGLIERGVSLKTAKSKRAITLGIEKSQRNFEETIKMNRPTIDQLREVLTASEKNKSELKQSDLTVTQQRKTNQELNFTRNEVTAMIVAREAEFQANLKKLREFGKRVDTLNKTKDPSPTARFAIRKEIEGIAKKFDLVAKEVRKDIALAGDVRSQFKITREINDMSKSFGQSRGFDR